MYWPRRASLCHWYLVSLKEMGTGTLHCVQLAHTVSVNLLHALVWYVPLSS